MGQFKKKNIPWNKGKHTGQKPWNKGKKRIVNRIIDDITLLTFSLAPAMRYETLDDWYDDGFIAVYEGMDALSRLAVGVHALVEMILCHLQGVKASDVTQWDTEGLQGEYDPKMYSKDERYQKAHMTAEYIERKIVEAAGMKWETYSYKLDRLPIKWEKTRWKK